MRSLNIKYIPELDQLRGLAALLVVSFHAMAGANIADKYLGRHDAIPVAHNPFELFLINGSTGVALFFVLSGFLFTWGALNGNHFDWKKFYTNRVLRIFPLFLLILLVVASLRRGDVSFGWLVQNLAGFGNFSKTQNDFEVVLWTIAVELQFYLLFPLLIALLKRRGVRYLLGIIAILCLLRLIAWTDHLSLNDAVYYTLLGRLDQFLIGMATAWLVVRRGWLTGLEVTLGRPAITRRVIGLTAGLLVALAAMLGLFWVYTAVGWKYSESIFQVVWTPLEALAWAAVGLCYVGLVRLTRTRLIRPLQFAGMISYSIYLLHYPIIRSLQTSGWTINLPGHPTASGYLTLVCIVLPITLAIAYLTYYVVEKPPLSLRRRYTAPDEPAL